MTDHYEDQARAKSCFHFAAQAREKGGLWGRILATGLGAPRRPTPMAKESW